MKLARYLSLAGVASRRKAEEYIRQGLIQVNGEVVDRPAERVSIGDRVYYRGQEISIPGEFVYILLHKPPGVITTMYDPQKRPTVAQLVKDIKTRVYPVGRLDRDACGLLLMTNDGEMAHRLQHPRYQVPKTYRVRVQGIPAERDLKRLRGGVELQEGCTAPARVKALKINRQSSQSILEIELIQGWKRQVKRMLKAVGLEVIFLQRTRFAGLALEGVAEGSYRYLNASELKHLREMVQLHH